jgi:hypothetical protein
LTDLNLSNNLVGLRPLGQSPEAQRSRYFDIVKRYNVRSFTHAEDVRLAFEGVIRALTERAVRGDCFWLGAVWGLPVAEFHEAITWCPNSDSLRLREKGLGLPSWSWLAWEGAVSARLKYAFAFRSIQESMPLCEWTFEPSASSPPSPRDGDETTTRRLFVDVQREEVEALGLVDLLPYVYTIAEVTMWTLSDRNLTVTRRKYNLHWEDANAILKDENVVTELFPDQYHDFNPEHGHKVELMAVSQLSAIMDLEDDEHSRLGPLPSQERTFIKARWIDRGGDGIAYRRGIAMIEKIAWDSVPVDGRVWALVKLG